MDLALALALPLIGALVLLALVVIVVACRPAAAGPIAEALKGAAVPLSILFRVRQRRDRDPTDQTVDEERQT